MNTFPYLPIVRALSECPTSRQVGPSVGVCQQLLTQLLVQHVRGVHDTRTRIVYSIQIYTLSVGNCLEWRIMLNSEHSWLGLIFQELESVRLFQDLMYFHAMFRDIETVIDCGRFEWRLLLPFIAGNSWIPRSCYLKIIWQDSGLLTSGTGI